MDLELLTRNLPTFKDHYEAKKWFKDPFRENFLIRCSEDLQGNKIYCYHIVKNKVLYQNYMMSFADQRRQMITDMATFESYSTVEISENGEVSVFI